MLDILSSNFSVAEVLMFVSKIDDQLSGSSVKSYKVIENVFSLNLKQTRGNTH